MSHALQVNFRRLMPSEGLISLAAERYQQIRRTRPGSSECLVSLEASDQDRSVEARGSAREQDRVEARGSAREQDRVEARGSAREQDRVEARGSAREQDRVEARGSAREQDRVEARGSAREQDRVLRAVVRVHEGGRLCAEAAAKHRDPFVALRLAMSDVQAQLGVLVVDRVG